jgi:membrane-bound lytic murein transglycosylase B
MTINEDKEFEPQVKETQEEEIKIGQDEQLQVLPENEQEEKEEILLTSSIVEPAKAKTSSSKAKSSRMRRRDVLSSVDVRKMLEKQNTQIHKITIMLQSIQKDTKSTQGQPKLMKRLESQIKLLQNQLVQIQKIITKKSVATSKSRSRKKVPTLKRAKKKR